MRKFIKWYWNNLEKLKEYTLTPSEKIDCLSFAIKPLVKSYRNIRDMVEYYIYERTGFTELHLAELKFLDEPQGTQVRPDMYLKEIGLYDGYTEYSVYLDVGDSGWLNFRALEDCTKRRF